MNSTELDFPARINAESEELLFIKTTHEELESLAFHDSRLNQNKKIDHKKNFSEISDTIDSKSVSFIFHTAFCGSTFLAKILGQTEHYFSIREPNIFMELANFLRVNPKIKNNKTLFQSWLKKAISSFIKLSTNKPNIVFKPTNATNNIIEHLLKSTPNSKALLLYSDLDSFLISILKKGESGKSFIRNLYNILSLDASPFALTDFRKVNCFTDLQIACLVWSMQMYVYQNLASSKYQDRIKFLNTNEFLKNPKNSVIVISQYFGEALDEKQILKIEQQGLFSSHAKYKDQKYNPKIRKDENVKTLNKYRQEFDEIHNWLNNFLKPPSIPSSKQHIKL